MVPANDCYEEKAKVERKTFAHILQALRNLGLDTGIQDSIIIGHSVLKIDNIEVGSYKYFNDIDPPLFYFQEQAIRVREYKRLEDGTIVPDFRLTMCMSGNACLEIKSELANQDTYNYLQDWLLGARPSYIGKSIARNAGASMLADVESNNKWIMVKFMTPKGAQNFVDFVNQNYKVKEVF